MRLTRLAIRFPFALTAGFLLYAASVQAEDADILDRVAEAVRTLNYQGVMVYAHGGDMHSLRIVHRYRNGREQERLQALTGEPREVLRDNEVVTCILPEDRKILVDRHDIRGPLSTMAALSPENLTPHYSLKMEPDQRLVDRDCQVVSLLPADDYRYGYRIWVDKQTQLPLRIDLLDTGGKTLEQVMFTQVNFPEDIQDTALQPAIDLSTYTWVRQHDGNSLPSQAGYSHWKFAELPPGYELVSHEVREQEENGPTMETFLFSDGLATVSAIIKPLGKLPSRLQGLSQLGAMHAYSKQSENYHVAVMGEVPADTVRFIAERLQPEPVTAAGQK